MTPLEKAARAAYHQQPGDKPYDQLLPQFKRYWEKRARAVISSIEPDDAAVKAGCREQWRAERMGENQHDAMRLALKAGLRSILAGETGE